MAAITAPATAITGDSVVIACASTDSDGTIANRAWTVTPSTGFTGSLTGAGGTLTFTAAGTYTIGLTVTDNQGATNVTSRAITVTMANVAPVAAITAPATAITGIPVDVACASTDSNGTISARAWAITPSTGFTGTLTDAGGTLTFTEAGTYTIDLTVTDNDGTTNTISRSVAVNTAPVAAITAPEAALTGDSVVIACASTDSNGTISARAWAITPSTGFTGTLTDAGGTLTFTEAGTYTIDLTVTDNDGATTTVGRTITVTIPIVTEITNPNAPIKAFVGAPVLIMGTAADPDEIIVSRTWTIIPSTGFSGTLTDTGGLLTFNAPGTYIVRQTIINNDGHKVINNRTIITRSATPVAKVIAPATITVGVPVTITCASFDADGVIVSRIWHITPNRGFTGILTETRGTLTFNVPGTYIIRLTVIDNHGTRSTASRTAIVVN